VRFDPCGLRTFACFGEKSACIFPDGDSHKIFQPTAGAGDDVQEKHVERNVYVAFRAALQRTLS